MEAGLAVIGADGLALATLERVRAEGVDVLPLCGVQLGDVRLTLEPGLFRVDGHDIGAILFREPPTATGVEDFVEEDRGFVLSEFSATWLAAAELPSVLSINRLGAEGWFEGGQWPVWQRRLGGASVDVSPLSFGDADSAACWRPYLGGERPVPVAAVRRALGSALGHAPAIASVLFVCGEPVGREKAPPAVSHAAVLLQAEGFLLVSIAHDAEGRVVSVNAYPVVPRDLIEPVAARLAVAVHDHLRRR